MAGLGIGIAWVGYSIFYYGVTQVQGGNWGLLDLMLPSRWAKAAGNPKDDGTSSAAKAPASVPGGGTNAVGSRQPQPTASQGVPSAQQQTTGLNTLSQKTGIPLPVQKGIR